MENVSAIVVDESLIDYHPSAIVKNKAEKSGEPIPVVFIPRKPHPNGLEIFQISSFLLCSDGTKLPFILDLIPHLKVGDVCPTEAIQQLMLR